MLEQAAADGKRGSAARQACLTAEGFNLLSVLHVSTGRAIAQREVGGRRRTRFTELGPCTGPDLDGTIMSGPWTPPANPAGETPSIIRRGDHGAHTDCDRQGQPAHLAGRGSRRAAGTTPASRARPGPRRAKAHGHPAAARSAPSHRPRRRGSMAATPPTIHAIRRDTGPTHGPWRPRSRLRIHTACPRILAGPRHLAIYARLADSTGASRTVSNRATARHYEFCEPRLRCGYGLRACGPGGSG